MCQGWPRGLDLCANLGFTQHRLHSIDEVAVTASLSPSPRAALPILSFGELDERAQVFPNSLPLSTGSSFLLLLTLPPKFSKDFYLPP